MKQVILASLLAVSLLVADDTKVVLPYCGVIEYDNKNTTKDNGTILGIYLSSGTLEHLVEFDYAHTTIKYLDSNLSNLEQNDFTLTYAQYYKTYMIKGGIHYLSTTDIDLGNGIVAIGEIGAYRWRGYDKISFGVEGYFSYYKDGYSEDNRLTDIKIAQLTPYFRFSKAINENIKNITQIKLNHQIAFDYTEDSYTSYEIENTLYYNKFSTTLKAYGGEMKTGVKDSGNTVFNTKDLLQNGYSLKVGYSLKSNLTLSASYAINNFEEYGQSSETSNRVAVATLNYSY